MKPSPGQTERNVELAQLKRRNSAEFQARREMFAKLEQNSASNIHKVPPRTIKPSDSPSKTDELKRPSSPFTRKNSNSALGYATLPKQPKRDVFGIGSSSTAPTSAPKMEYSPKPAPTSQRGNVQNLFNRSNSNNESNHTTTTNGSSSKGLFGQFSLKPTRTTGSNTNVLSGPSPKPTVGSPGPSSISRPSTFSTPSRFEKNPVDSVKSVSAGSFVSQVRSKIEPGEPAIRGGSSAGSTTSSGDAIRAGLAKPVNTSSAPSSGDAVRASLAKPVNTSSAPSSGETIRAELTKANTSGATTPRPPTGIQTKPTSTLTPSRRPPTPGPTRAFLGQPAPTIGRLQPSKSFGSFTGKGFEIPKYTRANSAATVVVPKEPISTATSEAKKPQDSVPQKEIKMEIIKEEQKSTPPKDVSDEEEDPLEKYRKNFIQKKQETEPTSSTSSEEDSDGSDEDWMNRYRKGTTIHKEGLLEHESKILTTASTPIITSHDTFNSILKRLDAPDDKNLTKIDMSLLEITDVEIDEFFKTLSLSKNVGLVHALIFDGNDITELGGKIISEFLKSPKCKLIYLSLKNNKLGDGGSEIFQSLTINKSLQSLSVESNDLPKDVCDSITQMLTKNSTLVDLNISKNKIDDDGLISICNGLVKNSTLQSIHLSKIGITEKGIAVLVPKMLNESFGKKLKNLVLNENKICDEGAEHISKLLAANSSLTNLELKMAGFTTTGMTKLVNSINSSRTCGLTTCNISINPTNLDTEIALFDLKIAKPKLHLIWRDNDDDMYWDEDETEKIINHLGYKKTVDLLMTDSGLDPLISKERVLRSIKVIDEESARYILKKCLRAQDVPVTAWKNLMQLILGVLQQCLLEAHEPSQSLAETPIFLQILLKEIPEFMKLLKVEPKQVPGCKGNVSVAVKKNAVVSSATFTSLKVSLLEMLIIIIEVDYKCIDDNLIENNVFQSVVDLLHINPLNNFMHVMISTFLSSWLFGEREHMINHAFDKCKFLDQLIDILSVEHGKPQTDRVGFSGHLWEFCNEIESSSDALIVSKRAANPRWKDFVANHLNKENEASGPFPWAVPTRPAGIKPVG